MLAFFCYFLVLFQTSFLVHFRFFGFSPNLILILVIILSIFNPAPFGRKRCGVDWKFLPQNSGIWAAFWGGFFLDIFSSDFIGVQAAILLAVSIITKLVFEKFLRFPRGI